MKIQPINRFQSEKKRPPLFQQKPQYFKSPLGVVATAAVIAAEALAISYESGRRVK